MDKVIIAAQALIDRWDTPLWKDVPATANYINDLRKALAEYKREIDDSLTIAYMAGYHDAKNKKGRNDS